MKDKVKYRSLTIEELQALEKEFVEFLIINGITADEWERIKEEDNKKAEKFLDLFSDVVFEEVLRKVEFLEFRSANELKVFHCLKEKMILVGIKVEDSNADLRDPDFIKKASVKSPENVNFFQTEKKYSEKREKEIFQMTRKGCEISDGKLFKTLCLLMAENKS